MKNYSNAYLITFCFFLGLISERTFAQEVYFRLPERSLISPESQGALAAGATSVKFSKADNVVLSQNYVAQPPITNFPSVTVDNATSIAPLLEFGTFERLDLLFSIPFPVLLSHEEDYRLGLKYEFVGPTRAVKEPEKFEVAGAVWVANGGYSTSQDNPTPTATFTQHSSEEEIDLIPGYRFNETFLLYTNLSYVRFRSSATIGAQGSGTQNGYALGAEYNFSMGGKKPDLFARAEVSLVQVSWSNAPFSSNILSGVSFGISWGR